MGSTMLVVGSFEGIGAEVLAKVERGDTQLGIMFDAAISAGNDHFGSRPLPPVEFWAACHTALKLGHGSIDIRGLAPHPLLVWDSSFEALRRRAPARPAGVARGGVTLS